MKNLLTFFAVMAISTAAIAADTDFNKTGIKLSADSKTFGVALTTGSSTVDTSDEAQVLDLHLNNLPVTLGVSVIDESDVRDLTFYVSKTLEMSAGTNGTAYVTPVLSTTDGDSYTDRELRFSPAAGYSHRLGMVTVFGEAQVHFTSNENDYAEFDRAETASIVGVSVPVQGAELSVSIVDDRDADFNQTDREAQIGMAFKF